MKVTKLFAGLSAAAVMASIAAAIPVSAVEKEAYNLGFNIQVGHCKNAKLTIKVKSTKDNIWDWETNTATNEGYMYTVQKSWNEDAPSDEVMGIVYGDLDENGKFKERKGATLLNNWECGPSKYQGQWAQITLTDDDLSALTFEVTFDGSDSKWEYHNPYEPVEGRISSADDISSHDDIDFSNAAEYQVFRLANGDVYPFETVSGDTINAQFGGVTSDQVTGSTYEEKRDAYQTAAKAAEDKGIINNGFYNASYTTTYTYSGADLAAAGKNNPEDTYDYGCYLLDSFMLDDGHEHSYTSKVTKAATCTESGVMTYTCECGDSYTEEIPPEGHKYTEKVVAPTTTAQGYTLHTCSVCGDSYKDNYTDKLPAETTKKVSISKATAKFSSTSITYTGKAKMPKLTVTYKGKTLVKGTDYKVTLTNSKKVGKATAKITGIGKYTGTKKLTYYVVPVKPTISKVSSAAKKKLTVKWKKNSTATGYQIQVSLKKNFSSKKSYSVSKNSTVKATISKLTSGKKYYVRMRCYKTIDGMKRYSAYSAVKTVKVK